MLCGTFSVSEAEAVAIRAAYERGDELAALNMSCTTSTHTDDKGVCGGEAGDVAGLV